MVRPAGGTSFSSLDPIAACDTFPALPPLAGCSLAPPAAVQGAAPESLVSPDTTNVVYEIALVTFSAPPSLSLQYSTVFGYKEQ